MAEVKQILVVDDHFEMLEFLRSMLELSSQDYEVLAVPSAEEGWLELRRGTFDLLITDVRLPGMSGFDLVRQAKRASLHLPIIVITAYSSSQGLKEATDLGVYQYFQKPLDTDDVLTAVNMALHGSELHLPPPPVIVEEEIDVTRELRKRLDTLRIDTGALQLMLATSRGQVVHTLGSGPNLDHAKLATIVARNINDSFLLADEIGSRTPFTLQYHAGRKLELYCANIGEHYFLTLFFDATARRGRIGTIWVFTQRAIKDLVTMLPDASGELPVVPDPQRAKRPAVARPAPVLRPAPKPAGRAQEPDSAAPLPAPPAEPEVEIELAPAEDLPVNITIIEEAPPAEPGLEDAEFLDIGADELTALLSEGGEEKSQEVDLDAFWDDALLSTDETGGGKRQGISVEEAIKQGLIPPDQDDDERRSGSA